MVSAKDLFSGMKTSLEREPGNPAMDKKLVITIAPTGSFITREQNPHQPYTPKEIAQQVIESCRAGATVWHVHCRDEKGIPSKDPGVIKETVDLVLDKCPDVITSMNILGDYNKSGIEVISPIVDPLAKAGAKYIRTAVVATHPLVIGKIILPYNQAILTDEVKYLQSKGIRPELQLHEFTGIDQVNDWLIGPGVLQKPYIMNLVLGFHAHHRASPTAPNPWGHIYLMTMLQTLPPGSVIGVTVGGHNWLPIAVEAIMMGADCLRIGMEDTIWMYPHKDDKIQRCADVVNKIVNIAHELGREIASPAETRKILGLGA